MILEIDMGGGRMPFPSMPGGGFPGEDAAAVSGTYNCSGDVFELTATIDGITLTNVWDRLAG
ncbi:hypothetical protein BH23ACT3_BH23ACT3_13690 [soil metagenome]